MSWLSLIGAAVALNVGLHSYVLKPQHAQRDVPALGAALVGLTVVYCAVTGRWRLLLSLGIIAVLLAVFGPMLAS